MALATTPPGATRVREEDRQRLKRQYAWITTQEELNIEEAAQIGRYLNWATKARPGGIENILADDYLKRINRRMFGAIWKWAGSYRRHNLDNEFTSPHQNIGVDMRNLWADLRELRDVAPQEFAVRLHHRIVKVHPFTDGNGRTSRAVADFVLQRHYGLQPLTWGNGDLRTAGVPRAAYIAALGQADRGHYVDLVRFCTN